MCKEQPSLCLFSYQNTQQPQTARLNRLIARLPTRTIITKISLIVFRRNRKHTVNRNQKWCCHQYWLARPFPPSLHACHHLCCFIWGHPTTQEATANRVQNTPQTIRPNHPSPCEMRFLTSGQAQLYRYAQRDESLLVECVLFKIISVFLFFSKCVYYLDENGALRRFHF